jgi:hypothetical protein
VEQREESNSKSIIAHHDDGSGGEIRLEIIEVVEDDRRLVLCNQRVAIGTGPPTATDGPAMRGALRSRCLTTR